MPVLPKHKVGRNEPCPCESGLKYKRCHGDPVKQMVCSRVANEKMVELIRVEQRKYIIAEQQKTCEVCEGTGIQQVPAPKHRDKIDGFERLIDAKCLACQFITDEERIKYEYDLSKGETE